MINENAVTTEKQEQLITDLLISYDQKSLCRYLKQSFEGYVTTEQFVSKPQEERQNDVFLYNQLKDIFCKIKSYTESV